MRYKMNADDGSPGWAVPSTEFPAALFKVNQTYWAMNAYYVGLHDQRNLNQYEQCVREGSYIKIPSSKQGMVCFVGCPPPDRRTGGGFHDGSLNIEGLYAWVPVDLLEPETNEWGEVSP